VACLAKSFPSAGCGRAPAGRAPCASSLDKLAIRGRKYVASTLGRGKAGKLGRLADVNSDGLCTCHGRARTCPVHTTLQYQ